MAVFSVAQQHQPSDLVVSTTKGFEHHKEGESAFATWDQHQQQQQQQQGQHHPLNQSPLIATSAGYSGSFTVMTNTTSRRIMAWQVWVMRWALFSTNLLTWYWSNGMNGIAMQSFASRIRSPPSSIQLQQEQQQEQQHQQHQHGLAFYVAVTSFVTALQLLLGAFVGSGLLVLLSIHAANKHQQQQRPSSFHVVLSLLSLVHPKRRQVSPSSNHHHHHHHHNEWFLSTLHGLGSLTTNLGFMYGTAYLVQIIKLLEPLETLLLSAYFANKTTAFSSTTSTIISSPSKSSSSSTTTSSSSSASSTVCRVGLVCSIVVVVGSAMSLVQWKQTSQSNTQVAAIFFALVSGCTLSLRNVFQQKQHATSSLLQQQQQQQQVCTTTRQSSNVVATDDDDDDDIDDENDVTTNPKVATSNTARGEDHPTTNTWIHLSKLERSVVQFTKLSFQSGLVMAAFSLLFSMMCWVSPTAMMTRYYGNSEHRGTAANVAVLSSTTATDQHTVMGILFQSLTWTVLMWHPMYNVTSMIVLGFCGSAVTHSLFNAGKRVFSILVALLWMEHQQQLQQQLQLQQQQHQAQLHYGSTSGNPPRTATYFRLFMVAVGAIWYTLETKQQQQQSQASSSYNNGNNVDGANHSTNRSRWHDLLRASSSSSNYSLPISYCGSSAFKNAPAISMTQLSKVVICVAMVWAVLFPAS